MLTELLKDKERSVRQAAADALGEIGPAAKMAIPALVRLLRDDVASDFGRRVRP